MKADVDAFYLEMILTHDKMLSSCINQVFGVEN